MQAFFPSRNVQTNTGADFASSFYGVLKKIEYKKIKKSQKMISWNVQSTWSNISMVTMEVWE